MKNQWKGFLAGVITTMLLLGFTIPVLAAYQKTATLNYNDITIRLDGQKVTPKDASGNKVEPFVLDDTTYLPVRGIASILGLNVSWDQTSQTVYLTTTDNSSRNTSQKTYPVQLKSGVYVVGKDIAPGVFDAEAISGVGGLFISDKTHSKFIVNTYLNADGDSTRYADIRLSDGDEVSVTQNLVIKLIPVS